MRKDADAIVIGAGVAGLAAAAALCQAGLDVVVLEARDRIGGRVHTRHDPHLEGPIELGAEFVHGRPRDLLAALEEAGTPPQAIEGDWLFEGEQGLEPLDLARALDPVRRRLREDRGPDRPFDAFLRSLDPPPDPRTAALALGYVEGFHAADPARVGTSGLARLERASQAEGGDAPRRVPAGLHRMVDTLRSRRGSGVVTLHLETVVREVRWSSHAVTAMVTTRDGTTRPPLRAACAVVTLPLGVLRAAAGPGAVRFTPDPKGVRDAVSRLEMGGVVKVILVLREPLWETAGFPGLAFVLSRRPHLPTWWTRQPAADPVLVGWAAGPAAGRLSGRGTRALVRTAVEEVAGLLRLDAAKVKRAVVGAHVADWGADPLARGAYSWEPVGAGDARARLAEPVADTLFFAGEAADAEGTAATLHGALASGRRAAIELLATL